MTYNAQVIPGRGEGRKLGFPTLNLEIPDGFTAKQGIYAGWVWFGRENGERMPAAIHYGPVPVFGVEKISLEAHIIDRDIPLPPRELSLELVKYLRPVRGFEAPQGLVDQMREDVSQARSALKIV